LPNDQRVLYVKHQCYHVFLQFVEKDHFVYSSFFVTKEANPHFMYQLGVTKVALALYQDKYTLEPSEWLYDLGLKMVEEMIEKGEIRSSGMITSSEMRRQRFDWSKLECIDTCRQYTQ